MFGAIIGDLAANTYLRRKETFYSQLIDDDARLSELNLSVIWASKFANSNPYGCSVNDLRGFINFLNKNDTFSTLISPIAKEWCKDPNGEFYKYGVGMYLMRCGTFSFWEGELKDCLYERVEKEDWYACECLQKILQLLYKGYTKDEVWRCLNGVFTDCYNHWKWRTEEGGTMNYLFRAWNNFYNAFDFGSALHNAVKQVGDIRINCALTGMIAAAMYGYQTYLKKIKYCDGNDPIVYLDIKQYLESYPEEYTIIKKQLEWNYVFWPKNNSRTNVERHVYKPVKSRFLNLRINPEIHRRILHSFAPDWDHRFSFYKDNGWIYVCRSFRILGRFKFKYVNGDFIISDTQNNMDFPEFDTGFHEAFYCVNSDWYLFNVFKYFRVYYHDTQNCPDEYRGSLKEKFWYGEMMFYTQLKNKMYEWIQRAKRSLNEQKNPKLLHYAQDLGPERFAVAFYINELFAKWNPYDNLDWIFEY